jgi:pilus assembly protein CpaB
MKVAQIAVLGIAVAAGTGAVMMMRGTPQPAPVPVVQAPPPVPKTEVLVAASDLPMGQALKSSDMRWQEWPADAAGGGLIKKGDSGGKTIEELSGSIVRYAMLNGEPIRREKLIKGQGGFMSAILPAGMRAVAISIDNRGSTSAGGFILPNDRVDVIKTEAGGDGAPAISEIILSNIRVLAIGQNVQERNGEKVVTGETATLELTPAQSEMIVLAQKVGQLSLALRSLADVNETGTPSRDPQPSALQVIRYGVQQQAQTK